MCVPVCNYFLCTAILLSGCLWITGANISTKNSIAYLAVCQDSGNAKDAM